MRKSSLLGNKLILIADSTKEGWEVFNEYECRDLPNNSDDGKCIGQAEARAYQKRCHTQSQRKTILTSKRSLHPALSSVPFNSPAVVHSPGPFLQTPALSATPSQNISSTIWPMSSSALRGSCLPVKGLAIIEASVLFAAFSPQLVSPASEFNGRRKLHAFTGHR